MACQGFCDTIEVAFGQTGMEGQRDGALEDTGRAGEVPLSPVGGELVERVGADLRLDPLLAKGSDLVRGAVDLDHVGLPAVDVTFVG